MNVQSDLYKPPRVNNVQGSHCAVTDSHEAAKAVAKPTAVHNTTVPARQGSRFCFECYPCA